MTLPKHDPAASRPGTGQEKGCGHNRTVEEVDGDQSPAEAVADAGRLDYPAAIALVALTGSFSTRHNANMFLPRGLVRPVSQKYTQGPVIPTYRATSAIDWPRSMRA
jgi:hypothetical protein